MFTVSQTTNLSSKSDLVQLINNILLFKNRINTPAMVVNLRSSDVMVLSSMVMQTVFRVFFFVVVIFHVSESFTGDCKYC